MNSSTPYYEAHLNMDITRFTTFRLMTCSSWSWSAHQSLDSLAICKAVGSSAAYLCHVPLPHLSQRHCRTTTVYFPANWDDNKLQVSVLPSPTSFCLYILRPPAPPESGRIPTVTHMPCTAWSFGSNIVRSYFSTSSPVSGSPRAYSSLFAYSYPAPFLCTNVLQMS